MFSTSAYNKMVGSMAVAYVVLLSQFQFVDFASLSVLGLKDCTVLPVLR